MIQIADKGKCCGCTACANICPMNAIKMKADEEGFLYPEVGAKCNNCSACDKVCPIGKDVARKRWTLSSFIVRTKDIPVLEQSTSGGFVTPLAEWVMNQGGYVCAASYDEEFNIIHTIISMEQNEELNRIRGSKYVQSNLNTCFLEIKNHLCQNKLVCFVGTTCQVSGLKNYLSRDYENLITVDLVCHGTPSPKLWRKYLDYQKERYHSDIQEVAFRNKTYGYHSGTMKIKFSNGKVYYGSGRVDFMLKSFFSEIASRPICYQCPFKTVERCSDFTIYDCWHAKQLVKGLKDDDKGYTNLIIQSKKGYQIFEDLKTRFEVYPVDIEEAIRLDGSMVRKSAKPHPKREQFYESLDMDTLSEHIDKFIKIRRLDNVLEHSKMILYKMGLMKVAKKIKGNR